MANIANKVVEFMGEPLFTYDDVSISVFVIVKIVIILILLKLALLGIKKIIKTQAKKRELHEGDLVAIYQIIKYLLISIVIIMIMASMGINTTVLLTSSAALMVGIGFGLQQIFKDLLSGILILFDRVIRVGDIVQVGDVLGKVIKVHLRTSHVITRDDVNIIIPNSKFVEENVTNWTLDYNHVRLTLSVGVAYGSDTALVKDILIKIAKNSKEIISEPHPRVRFYNFGDSSLDFQLLVWTKEIFRQEFVKSDLRFEIDKAFREANITIPFPQRTVWHMKEGGEVAD
jgi:small-conductance mechanosensitive channel